MISMPLSGLGLLLALVAALLGLLRKGRGMGFPMLGAGVNLLALVIAGFWLKAAVSLSHQVANEADLKRQESTSSSVDPRQPNQSQVARTPPVTANLTDVTVDWAGGEQVFHLTLANHGNQPATVWAIIYATNNTIQPPEGRSPPPSRATNG